MNPLVKRQDFGQTVYCTWSDRETFTRVHGGKAFCADCGDTGHAAVTT
jgi:hypothetical protein